MGKRILVLEDDGYQYSWIESVLKNTGPGAEITRIETESKFLEWIKHLQTGRASLPDLFILDVMVKWTTPSKLTPRPEHIQATDSRRAGMRCGLLVRTCAQTRNKPIIIYTILQRTDVDDDDNKIEELGSNVRFVPKTPDENELIKAVRSAIY